MERKKKREEEQRSGTQQREIKKKFWFWCWFGRGTGSKLNRGAEKPEDVGDESAVDSLNDSLIRCLVDKMMKNKTRRRPRTSRSVHKPKRFSGYCDKGAHQETPIKNKSQTRFLHHHHRFCQTGTISDSSSRNGSDAGVRPRPIPHRLLD